MFLLTRREQCVIVSLLLIFLIGMGVKQWRQAHGIPRQVSNH